MNSTGPLFVGAENTITLNLCYNYIHNSIDDKILILNISNLVIY